MMKQKKGGFRVNSKAIRILSWCATGMSLIMYVSYIAMIVTNLQGDKGNFVQPLAATLNCLLWTVYGFVQKPKQWPLIIANVPGIFLAAVACITCF